MATNKRKDSAALFELIDKSTLKVPKSGSLKIPSWWSSKNNPAPAETTPPAPSAPASIARPVAPQAKSISPELPSQTDGAPTDTEVSAEPAHAPTPLFESAPSPSIRPPAPSTGARFGPPATSNGNGSHPPTSNGNGHHTAVLETKQIPEEQLPEETPVGTQPLASSGPDAYAGLGAGTRVFAPQTMSQTSGYTPGGRPVALDWSSSQKLRLARLPMWVMVAGASGIAVVLLLIIYLLVGFRPQKPAPTTATPLVNPNSHQTSLQGPTNHQLLPPPNNSNNNVAGNLRDTPVPPPPLRDPTPPPAALTPGQVYLPGSVNRTHDSYYIIVATTPSETIARRNADLLAKNGINISIETQMGKSNRFLYRLISVDGFKSLAEAQPLRKRIVEVGHQLPDFAKTHKAWDDATVMKWSSLLAAAARG